jgi:nitroimidazol reductase NimA-like FMN-containing flavoprotein (pyridoxamine 5'-phosphate oxidase superfamily)
MGELTMSKDDREAFLAEPHVAVISLARKDAPALAAPVWYRYEPGGDVLLSLEAESEKIRLIEAAGHASRCVQKEAMPYKYVTVEGPTALDEPDDGLEGFLARRYLGDEIAELYLQAIEGSVSRVVRLRIDRWRTVDYTKMVDRVLGVS